MKKNERMPGEVEALKEAPEKPSAVNRRERLSVQEREAAEREGTEGVESLRGRIRGKQNPFDAERLGDFSGSRILENGQIALTPEEYVELNEMSDQFFEEVRDSAVATNQGYPVAGAYDTQVKGWTTQTKIIEINGKKAFVVCSYPESWKRRTMDRFMERLSGDPMRKPKPSAWKDTVEKRNRLPTIAATRPDMVVMPYIESMNAYDLFAHQPDIKDFGPFEWAKEMPEEEKLELIPGMVQAVYDAHEEGVTWGESILPNLLLDKNKKPILIDAETTYEGISVDEQKARDVRNLITSISGAIARTSEKADFEAIASRIIDAYPDEQVINVLRDLCAKPLGFRQRTFFNLFSRWRIGASDLNEFEEVSKAIVKVIEGRKKES